MREVLRKKDLDRLSAGRDRPDAVKVITGMRRCGKSTLMRQYIDLIKGTGVNEEDVLYLNMESASTVEIEDFKDLNRIFARSLPKNRRCYVFLDEIQRVKEWERAVNSLMTDFDADIYITGSNAYLLSSELSTYLSGRYVEIDILPLSFKEYLELNPPVNGKTIAGRFEDYIWTGSLPMIDPDSDPGFIRDHLTGICHTIISKDVSARKGIRNADTIFRITDFLFHNIGNPASANSTAGRLGENNVTVRNYMRFLEEAYIFYRAPRYDVAGNKLLSGTEKFYASDTGMRNAVLGMPRDGDISRQIENIVYLELRRRRYNVRVGSYLGKEIDFTAEKGAKREYFQISLTLLPDDVFEREVRSLREIGDSYPKTILTLDAVKRQPPGGIVHMNVIDWLLSDW